MSLTWGDWLRFIVTPLVVAGITAIVAARNAKKTPHERLKNLVDIRKNMPVYLDSRNVVESAIARELVDFDRRLAADQRGFWAGARERVAQFEWPLVSLVAAAVFSVGTLIAALVDPGWRVVAVTALTFLAVSVAIFLAARIAFKAERLGLSRDRASAEISAHFPREFMQEVGKNGIMLAQRANYLFSVAEKLTDMGVFEREVAVENSDEPSLQVERFTLTPFGRRVWDWTLAEAERQHVAKWTDLAGENGEGDGCPGRGAPGA
ncbi:hypothetical protein MHN80_23690 [Gordonia McavH-238-E]|uniref:hypothetical protein n=1 Tax=Gordonia sp. McavH-238-E TaxID=2917736 RepID=UPI001EF55D76|nr:hypothetical protein [Gordonia sp. McavH-238-E]MCG7635321.1 hypothetical protein [Gordonia sp. McavH-238-E]